MMNAVKIRKWATPLTIGTFAMSAISGAMIFFHLNSPLIKVVHKWGSWLLVIGGLFHVLGSWQSFIGYFSRPAVKTVMVVFALVIAMFFFSLGGRTEGHGKRLPPALLSRALPEASFATVAGIARHQPDRLIEELASQGINISDKEKSIREIARENNREDVEILNAIF